MRYEETYNASEGFFAIQDDPAEAGMLLMLDYGIFYEFIPLDELPASGDYSSCRALRLEEVELGRDYAMVISTLGWSLPLHHRRYGALHLAPPLFVSSSRAARSTSSMPLVRR